MHHLQSNYKIQLQFIHNHSNAFTIVTTLLSKSIGRYTQPPIGHCPKNCNKNVTYHSVVYGDLVDATQMENEKRFENWSRIDALDADWVA